jgi:hypothetical protein
MGVAGGLDIILRTGGYRVSDALYRQLASAGAYGPEPAGERANVHYPGFRSANQMQTIEFGYGRSRDGLWRWVTDAQGDDTLQGWTAGRAYVEDILGGPDRLLALCLMDRIPAIE